jgi:sterol desaturase/sphingolipid hydroxylase (fatty acid hydroxylase superfamily)
MSKEVNMNFDQWLISNEPVARLSVFVAILCVMMLLEVLRPKRKLSCNKPVRWMNNISLVVLNTVLMRLLLPFATVAVAWYAIDHNLGLFNVLSLPIWLEIVLSIFILDLIIYWQHRIFHKVPVLWRLHRVHHVDQDIDVTTGSRFHPIEIFLSLMVKFSAVIILGVPVMAVILFEIILNAAAMFNHSNVALPKSLDKYIRWFLVTPDMHRVHHSRIVKETNSNYGFNIPLWDRIFTSYIAQPKLGHTDMEIGVKGFDEKSDTQHLHKMLSLPFKD